jgi:hypothetical protein
MKPEVTKLPKWAQEHIQTIERQRDHATATLKKFLDSQTPSSFFVEEFVQSGTIKHYIQTNKITVKLDNDKEIYINKEQDGSFYLASGWGGLQIEPSASNAIRIKVKP